MQNSQTAQLNLRRRLFQQRCPGGATGSTRALTYFVVHEISMRPLLLSGIIARGPGRTFSFPKTHGKSPANLSEQQKTNKNENRATLFFFCCFFETVRSAAAVSMTQSPSGGIGGKMRRVKDICI